MILREFPAKAVKEGAGVMVNRVFGYNEVKDFDPFLMLDYFEGPENLESPGFPWHPHKGIETITYMIKGSGKHEDSLGNKGTIGPGELQWMTAGSGIMHQEMPGESPQGSQGFQFWVNMPARDKYNQPSYQYIKKGQMKAYKSEGITVNVIAGNYKGIKGPIDKSNLEITMLHGIVKEGYSMVLDRHVGKKGYLFVFEGRGRLNDQEVKSVTAYTLDQGEVIIQADRELSFIFAQGKPLNEPIAWHGPIVMNTREELVETFRDLEKGTFVK